MNVLLMDIDGDCVIFLGLHEPVSHIAMSSWATGARLLSIVEE